MLTAEQFFANGNSALRDGRYASAIRSYVSALMLSREEVLTAQYGFNLAIARDRYRAERENSESIDVGVCCWDLAHNAAGRAYTIATIYEVIDNVNVTLLGGLFERNGGEIWGPLKRAHLFTQTLLISDEEQQFVYRAADFVLKAPRDVVHLIKPRFPNIIFGIMYKLIWGAQVIMDVDDNELAFVKADSTLKFEEWIAEKPQENLWARLAGQTATRIAVGLAQSFDGVTVANSALQERFGGQVVRHARDPCIFKPTDDLKTSSRKLWGISSEQQVVMFLGTPRAHKGLLETADALASLQRSEIVYFVVGSFPVGQEGLKSKLEAIQGLTVRFAEDQPQEEVPSILSCADLVILLQDPMSPAAKCQTPAKLSDALAMGLPVLAEVTPGIADLAAQDEQCRQIIPVTRETLRERIRFILQFPQKHAPFNSSTRKDSLFQRQLSLSANATPLQGFLRVTARGIKPTAQISGDLKAIARHEQLSWLTNAIFRATD